MNEAQIRENDYENGVACELDKFIILRNKGFNIEPTERYCFYDCKINDNYLCEIKKRSIAKNKYPTTIVPYSKVLEYRKIQKSYKDFIFIFSFTDGDWYTSYNELMRLVKKNVTIYIKPFTRYTGFQHTTRKHIHIPVELLKPLEQLVLE